VRQTIYPGHSSCDSVGSDETEGGGETGSGAICKPQVGGSIPLASSTTSVDVSTLGVFQNHVPSRSIQSVHPQGHPLTLWDRPNASFDGCRDTETNRRNVRDLVEAMLRGDVHQSTMTCWRRMD